MESSSASKDSKTQSKIKSSNITESESKRQCKTINESKSTKEQKQKHNNRNPKSNSDIYNSQTNSQSPSKEIAKEQDIKKKEKDLNTINGFPIHCSLCQIAEPFKSFTDVVAHLYGQRHRRVGYKMVYLDSSTSITFKGKNGISF